jgi:hypothetical protein
MPRLPTKRLGLITGPAYFSARPKFTKGEFEVEAQFFCKLHTKNGEVLLKLLLKGTQKRGSVS